ncbi:DUF2264 domain-containing protein [Streptomyces sp. NPDC019224]|uniref:DUF2264 domain-containing protein n=1 Tax=Streptomyces sp. NPDC019224 TaxID=3154484 RepID=UPI0033E6FD02
MTATGVPLPREDRTQSPLTGWTRAHWEHTADRLLSAVRPYASSTHALIDLPGPTGRSGRHSDGLEGFARTFLLAAFRLARSGDHDPLQLAERYARGIAAGTDPASPERWPTLRDTPQAKVEAASIVLALHETRPLVWDRLDDAVRERVVEWLAPAVGQVPSRNNWAWFQGVTNAFLRSVGGPWSPDDVDAVMALNEEFYVGDGWYADGTDQPGDHRRFDYYSGWAMHFYPLWFCRIAGEDAYRDRMALYRERLSRYLQDAAHLVGADGAPVFQGRSLTYRMAVAAPFWTGALFDATPLAPGLTRRLASGVLRYFLDGGCVDERGLLSLGWRDAFPRIRQPYSGPASPYWASKGFAGLLLPADHPVWTAVEEPLPVEEADTEFPLTGPGWLVSGTRRDGIVRLVQHGGDHADPRFLESDDSVYARHAYATAAGPAVGGTADSRPVDAHVALVRPDGSPSLRRPWRRLRLDGRVGVSRHRAHWLDGELPDYFVPDSSRFTPGPVVTTASVLHGGAEVRLARVDAWQPPDRDAEADGGQAPGLPEDHGPWTLSMSGLPVADEAPVQARLSPARVDVTTANGLTSTVIGLRGLTEAAAVEADGTNAFGRYAAVPTATSGQPVRHGEVYAALLVLAGDPAIVTSAEAVTVDMTEDAHGNMVSVDWGDGHRDEVRLDPPGSRTAETVAPTYPAPARTNPAPDTTETT